MESMTFKRFREDVLLHIYKEHALHLERGRRVKLVECLMDMRTGNVGRVKLIGYDYEKTFDISGTNQSIPIAERMHAFLDGHPDAEDEDAGKEDAAILATASLLVATRLLEEFEEAVMLGEEFGAKTLDFKVPIDVMREAIEDVKSRRARK
jgi:hypothetical protein